MDHIRELKEFEAINVLCLSLWIHVRSRILSEISINEGAYLIFNIRYDTCWWKECIISTFPNLRLPKRREFIWFPVGNFFLTKDTFSLHNYVILNHLIIYLFNKTVLFKSLPFVFANTLLNYFNCLNLTILIV
jgi:hypothetical protein